MRKKPTAITSSAIKAGFAFELDTGNFHDGHLSFGKLVTSGISNGVDVDESVMPSRNSKIRALRGV